MSIFTKEAETKRVIFNVRIDLAERLEKAKEESRRLGKRLDVDSSIDKAVEKFLKKAEKKIEECVSELEHDAGKKLVISAVRPLDAGAGEPGGPGGVDAGDPM